MVSRKEKTFKEIKKNLDTDDIKVGLYIQKSFIEEDRNRYRINYYCNCGNNKDEAILERYTRLNTHTCSECKNEYFIEYEGNPLRLGAFYIDELKTSLVKASRLNFTADYVNGNFKVLRVNMMRKIELDVVQRKFIVHRNDELEFSRIGDELYISTPNNTEKTAIARINSFFVQGMGDTSDFFINHILRKASNIQDFPPEQVHKSREFYDGISSLRTLMGYNYGRSAPKYKKTMNVIGIIRFCSEPFEFAEKLINAGIKVKFTHLITREYSHMAQAGHYYVYSLNSQYDCLNADRKKLHQALSCPKGFLKIIRDREISVDREMLGNMDRVFCYGEAKKNKTMKFIDTAIEKNVFEDVFPRYIGDIMELVEEYNYDHETLIDYLFVSCPMYQGITSTKEILNLMRDYLDMSVKMGYKYDKYPESLKRSHDVKMVNYNLFRSVYEGEEFTNAVKQYNDLIYQDKEYQIVVPTSDKDLVKEGSNLNHCIASYKDRLISGRSLILFMRDKDSPQTPLVSIELSKYFEVVQARGQYNRVLTNKERGFMEDWKVFIGETISNRRKYDDKIKIESF